MLFPLPLFPEGSLVSSIITTTWVGCMVVAFFNLRLGWVLSGLVVPGYLVPLVMLKPVSATVIIIEAIVTYALVWSFSEYMPRFGQWSRLFGRDRFFALVLCSVIVRVVFDAFLLPAVASLIDRTFAIQVSFQNDLHSFGLIIISLTANQFWKTGLRRGLVMFAVTMATTYLIVRYGLMELTNFRISNLTYLYEDLATSILASPKAYIILLTTAFLASRMNLKYGLDYSGILIPALIALQWYQPSKILTTAIEAGLIYVIGVAVLKLPIFANVTIEGARKLILFFNIGFVYKLVLGHLLLWLAPDLKITDFFGFGYLLATLLAIKMHDKNILLRVSRATIQTSLTGVILASLIGFALILVPSFGAPLSSSAPVGEVSRKITEESLADIFDQDRVQLYAGRLAPAGARQSADQIEVFEEAVALLHRQSNAIDPTTIATARALLSHVGYSLLEVDGRYYYLRDTDGSIPRGIFVIDRAATDTLLIEVPVPLESPYLVPGGLALAQGLQARALAVAPAEWNGDGAVATAALNNYDTFFNTFHRVVAGHNVLQLRARDGRGGRPADEGKARAAPAGLLRVKDRIPTGLRLNALEALVGAYDVEFGVGRVENIQRDEVGWGFAELFLDDGAARELVLRGAATSNPDASGSPQVLTEAAIAGRVLAATGSVAHRGTDLYREPSLAELLFFDTEVLTPALRAISTAYHDGRWSEAGLARLRAAALAAGAVGYGMDRIADERRGGEFLLFEETASGSRRGYRGTFVVRVDRPGDYIVQVPRPLQDVGVIEFGTTLFEDLKGGALLVAGAHPHGNLDGSANIVEPGNRHSFFNLFNQVLLRESGRRPVLMVQCRAMREADVGAEEFDAIVSFDDGAVTESQLSELSLGVLRRLQADGMALRFADGSADVVGHDAGDVSQAAYLSQSRGKEFMAIWLASRFRLSVARLDRLDRDRPQFDALFIPTEERSLSRFLRERGMAESDLPTPEIRRALRNFRESRDIVQLQVIDDLAAGYRLLRLVDSAVPHPYLAFLEPDGVKVAALANLSPAPAGEVLRLPMSADDRAVGQAIELRPDWIVFGDAP
jgi:hypothetical protein